MKNNEAAMVNVQFDVSEMEGSGNKIVEMLNGLKGIADDICKSVSTTFHKATESMKDVADGANSIADSLNLVVEKMDEIIFLMQDDTITNWHDLISTAVDSISFILELATLGFAVGELIVPGIGGVVGAAIGAVIGLIIELVTNWDTIRELFISVVEWINTKIIQPFITLVSEGIAAVQNVFAVLDEFLQNVFSVNWAEHFGIFGHVLNGFFTVVKSVWESVKQVFAAIATFVSDIFAGNWKETWENIKEIIASVWSLITAIITGKIRTIIATITSFLSTIWDKIKKVLDWLGLIDTSTEKSVNVGIKMDSPTAVIPKLAQGAVLPANRPFLAMVGDQKHGTNVEAPLATIQEALANVLAQQGMGGDIHITFTGDLAQLGRVLKPVIERENRRVGTSLVKGVM